MMFIIIWNTLIYIINFYFYIFIYLHIFFPMSKVVPCLIPVHTADVHTYSDIGHWELPSNSTLFAVGH